MSRRFIKLNGGVYINLDQIVMLNEHSREVELSSGTTLNLTSSDVIRLENAMYPRGGSS